MGIRIAFVTGPEENLGIKYLSAVLKDHGHDTALFIDPQLFRDEILSVKPLSRFFDSRKVLIRELLSYQPDLIGFSVCTDFSEWAVNLASEIKRKAEIPIVFGGIHPTSVPEEVIRHKAVDIVCVGEGEFPLAELADSLLRKDGRTDIRNLWFKKDGEVIKNPLRPLTDVNVLPFPDHELYAAHRRGYFNIGYHTIASRGCPYRCSYCCHSVVRGLYDAKGYYRVRHPDHLVEELEIAKKKYPFRIVRFYDDIFPYEIPWLKEFSALYRARVALPFICYLHPGLVNEERIGFLKEAGCSEIRIGVQTLNSEIRKNVLARSETNLSIEKAIDSVKRYGIKVVTENILGLPCEKDADVIQMMDFYNRNRPHRNHFFWLRYYPGLEITTRRSEWSAVPANFSDGQVFTQGGDTYKIANRQLIAALHLLPFLPEKVMEYFIDHKFWKFIPAWSPLWFLNLIANMTSGSDSDRIWRDRTAKRYLSSLMGSS